MKIMIRAAFALLVFSCATTSPAPAADKFAGYVDTVSNQARIAAAVVPSDSTDLTDIPKALYIGTGGNIAMIGVDAAPSVTCASAVVWKNTASGSTLPFRPRRICATGTTAADILAIR